MWCFHYNPNRTPAQRRFSRRYDKTGSRYGSRFLLLCARYATSSSGVSAPRASVCSAALRTGFSRLRQALEQEGIPLGIHPGAEVFCTPELPELLDRRQLQTLGGGRYLLVEFYFDESAEFMEQCFHQIRTRGLTPVAAHPERYDAVQRDPYIIRRWFEGGVVIQLNKGSILGRLGRRAQDTALWLLERGLAHAAASDAHRPTVRTTHMELLRRTLAEDFSPACPRLLLEENPRRILEDRPLVGTDEPIFSPREDEL